MFDHAIMLLEGLLFAALHPDDERQVKRAAECTQAIAVLKAAGEIKRVEKRDLLGHIEEMVEYDAVLGMRKLRRLIEALPEKP